MKEQIIQQIKTHKIIAILRGVPQEKLIPLLEALYEGGIRLAEITFDAKGVTTDAQTAQYIRTANDHFQGRMLIGAGTVLTPKQVELAVAGGATFIISPNTDLDVISATVKLGAVSIPGAITPTESVTAVKAGADFVKIFPSDTLGPKYFKAICAPLSHIPFMAVGGVDHLNAKDFLAAGAVGIGVSSNIINKQMLLENDYQGITQLAKLYVEAVQ